MESPKRKTAIRMIAFTVVMLVVLGVWMVYRALESVRNSYAIWWVADMVVVYMEANENRWPRNWDDLREPYNVCTRRSAPWTFEELQSRVDVDWLADPALLVNQTAIRVIWLKDGSDSHWESRDPNIIIRDYLRRPATAELTGQDAIESQKVASEK